MKTFTNVAFETVSQISTRLAFAEAIVAGEYHNVGTRDAKVAAVTPAIVLRGKYDGKPVSFQVYYGYAVEIRSGNGSQTFGKFSHKRGQPGINWQPMPGVAQLTEDEAIAMVVLANSAIETAGVEFQEWLLNTAIVEDVLKVRTDDPLRKAFGLKSGLDANQRFQAKRLANGLPAGNVEQILADREASRKAYEANRNSGVAMASTAGDGFGDDSEIGF